MTKSFARQVIKTAVSDIRDAKFIIASRPPGIGNDVQVARINLNHSIIRAARNLSKLAVGGGHE